MEINWKSHNQPKIAQLRKNVFEMTRNRHQNRWFSCTNPIIETKNIRIPIKNHRIRKKSARLRKKIVSGTNKYIL